VSEMTTHAIRCWLLSALLASLPNMGGCYFYGETDGSLGPDNAPPPAGPNVLDTTSGGFHTCALLNDGTVRCWGGNFSGELGVAPSQDRASAEDVPNLAQVVSLSSDSSHTCGLGSDHTVRCWGGNTMGQLGLPDTDAHVGPVTVAGLTDVVQLDVGYGWSCAVRDDGTVWCWGGTGALSGIGLGIEQVADATDMVQVSVSQQHACAVHQSGSVWCWLETNDPPRMATEVSGLGDVLSIKVARYHYCVVFHDRTMRCYSMGHLSLSVDTPDAVVDVCGGEGHTCVAREDGSVYCWGDNEYGQLGDTTWSDRADPVRAVGIIDAVGVSCGPYQTCATHQSGAVSCWGWNTSGQVGDGTLKHRNRPVWVTQW